MRCEIKTSTETRCDNEATLRDTWHEVALCEDCRYRRRDTYQDCEPIAEHIAGCPCGQLFTAAAWARLRFVGVQRGEDVALELRDCDACGSTRAIVLDDAEAAE